MEIELKFDTPQISLEFEDDEELTIDTPTIDVTIEEGNEIELDLDNTELDVTFGTTETFEIAFPTTEVELDFHGGNTTVTYEGGGAGDMTKAIYDPTTVEADAFLLDNQTGTLEDSTITIDGGLLG